MQVSVEKTTYRPDIDGLRAIAVLSVILFHIDKRLIPGGFVGVDIFFVISGFLISLHILQEIEAGQFSIVEFYRRRVKRIAPPMLVVVLITLIAAQFLMIPEDAERAADSALWSLVSLANVYFWWHQDTSYFSAASSELPLLHLWSLGVEEQFYIIWPIVLLLVYRKPYSKLFIVLTALVAMASYAAGQYWFASHSSFVYYMLPTRAGELLIGALVAVGVLRGVENRVSAFAAVATGGVGLTLIVGSLFLLNEEMVFPGLLAVPPTLGAAMLILAGYCARNRISALLTVKPLLWVGLVSYSAYLWHWPILAFIRYGYGEVGLIPGAVVMVLTFGLAWLSYRFIEQPARYSKATAKTVFTVQYILPAGAIAVLALAAMYIDGYGLRWHSVDYKSSLATFRDQTRPAYLFDYVCQRQRVSATDIHNEHCVLGAKVGANPKVILWGDSNAAHYVGVIGAIAREAKFSFRNIEIGSCPPLLADPEPFVNAKRLPDCLGSASTIREAVMAADIVIISASWSDYLLRSDKFLDVFFETTKSLTDAGKQVILMAKAPAVAGYDRRCREKALSYPFLECSSAAISTTAEVATVNASLKRHADQTPNVAYFDIASYLCPTGRCSAFDAEGKSLYYDPSHLSLPGSWLVGGMILGKVGVPEPFSRISSWPAKSLDD
jgi:peptidoglycan/LPS O-acetylase OafA/YrhL